MVYRRLTLAILALVVSLLFGSNAYAYTLFQQNAVNEGRPLYLNDEDVSCSGITGGGSLVGKENEEKIFRWLVAKGLTNVQAAGVVGNMAAESGFNPARNQGDVLGAHAWGLAQWDFGRRDSLVKAVKANAVTAPLYDIKYGGATTIKTGYIPAGMTVAQNDALILLELNFLYQESTNRPVTATGFGDGPNEWAVLKKQTNVEDATVFWHNNFEVSSDSASEVLANRLPAAQDALKRYGGSASSVPTGGVDSACPDGTGGNTAFEKTLLSFAWPDYKGQGWITKMPAYAARIRYAAANGLYVGYDGIDCGAFVTNLMLASGFDTTYNSNGKGGNTSAQYDWLRAHWHSLGMASSINPAKLQAGDVAISNGHTFVWVASIDPVTGNITPPVGFHARMASASGGGDGDPTNRAPMADTQQSATDHNFEWFRK
jgi:hypothetical protein